MEEILALKQLIQDDDKVGAMLLIEEMEEMGRSDKVNQIYSYSIILLSHLIKQYAEKRTTKSWEVTIELTVDQIKRTNKRHKAGGNYVADDELKDLLSQSYKMALKQASLEAFGGIYSPATLAGMVNREEILAQAWEKISAPEEV